MLVSPATVAILRARLWTVAIRAPSAVAVIAVIEMIDRDCRVADLIRRE